MYLCQCRKQILAKKCEKAVAAMQLPFFNQKNL